MKTLPVIFSAALLGAVLLIALLAGGAVESLRVPVPSAPPLVTLAVPARAASARPAPDAQTWPRLDTTDLASLVARLRAAGFPPAMVRALVLARLNEQYAARRRALDPAAADLPFWKTTLRDPRLTAARNALDREQEQLARSLLGADYENPFDVIASVTRNRGLDNLSPAKLAATRKILEDYGQRTQDIVHADGSVSGSSMARFLEIEHQQADALAQVLSPDELKNYRMFNDYSAQVLQATMDGFNPTQQEFDALYALRQALDTRVPPASESSSDAERAARQAAEQQYQDQARAALGPDRYEQYQRSQDYNYRETVQLVSRLGLPHEAANQAWSIQQDTGQRLSELAADPSLTPAQRTTQSAALLTAAETRLATLLGPSGAKVYPQYGGQWLNAARQNLAPPVTPKP